MVYDDYAGNLHINFAQEIISLMVKDLVKYIRFRNDSQGDIGRIKRQQQVIERFYDQLFKFESLHCHQSCSNYFYRRLKLIYLLGQVVG